MLQSPNNSLQSGKPAHALKQDADVDWTLCQVEGKKKYNCRKFWIASSQKINSRPRAREERERERDEEEEVDELIAPRATIDDHQPQADMGPSLCQSHVLECGPVSWPVNLLRIYGNAVAFCLGRLGHGSLRQNQPHTSNMPICGPSQDDTVVGCFAI